MPKYEIINYWSNEDAVLVNASPFTPVSLFTARIRGMRLAFWPFGRGVPACTGMKYSARK
jgi:hypothetical protein